MKITTNCYQGEITVSVNKTTKSFSLNGYRFTLSIGHKSTDLSFDPHYTSVEINGSDWDEPLETIILSGHKGLEDCVKSAVRWISSHV